MEKKELKRGQIFMIDLGEVSEYSGSLQRGLRPCILISNNMACRFSPILTIIPLTTKYAKRSLPTHYYVQKDEKNNLIKTSLALGEQIISINKKSLGKYIGELSHSDILEIDKVIGISLGLELTFA